MSYQHEQNLACKQIYKISNCLKGLYMVDLSAFIKYFYPGLVLAVTFNPKGMNSQNLLNVQPEYVFKSGFAYSSEDRV